MFFRGVCYGCAAVCGTTAIYHVGHGQAVPAALLAAVAVFNYYVGGKAK